MLTVTIGCDYALPIRAIPFCSHGFISALSVAEFLANPESFPAELDARNQEDVDHPLTRYESPPTPFRIDALGKKDALHPGIFLSLPHTVKAAMDSDDPLASIKALPPGIQVRLDEINRFYDFLNFKCEEQELNARGSSSSFRQWRDIPFLNIDDVTTGLIMEGTERKAQTSLNHKVKRSGSGGTDPFIQVLADKESNRIYKLTGKYPKKIALAEYIHKQTGRKANTLMREFKSLKPHK